MPCPLPPNQSVICLAPYHHITASPHHCVSQSFALHPATKPVSHLPCPLPPNQSVICLVPYHCITASLHHHVTASLHHHATTSPCHHISQSFALPPATKPVSHLPCPLPPHPASPHHHITALVSHLPCPLPPNQSVICLAPCHQTSESFALPPTTMSLGHCITVPPRHCITVLVSHLPCPLPPSQSVICLAPCHQTSQSFALPPTTASLHHRVTALVSHLPCPLPPSQSVICLAPCHQTSQSFALPLPPCHHITVSLPQIFPTTWV